jgi:outer membrane protein assembly factor BamE (lipoprotein component of BamABCDE complex)
MNAIKIIFLSLFVSFSFILTGCQTIEVRGQHVEKAAIDKIQNNEMTKEQVTELIGTPTIIPDYSKDTWYYVERAMSKRAWFLPKVLEQKILKITFVDNKVTEVLVLEDDHDDEIRVDSDYTRVYGTEKTGVQKFVHNFGRFNKTSDSKIRKGSK